MKIEEVAELIQIEKPQIIYLSGKTCTGKTTFANNLQKHGYSILELDTIVIQSVIIPYGVKESDGFLTAYRDAGPEEQTQAFIETAKKDILEKSKLSPVVVEGAIARPRILKEILSDDLKDFEFIYLHPINIDLYKGRIRERFINGAAIGTSGLPKHFWEMVKKDDLQYFIDTREINEGIEKVIEDYTKLSMQESFNRLSHFQKEFSDIKVIEI
jgi:guanylate kinase